MKKLKGNFAVKTCAVILSFFTVTALIISSVAIGIMFYYDFYTRPFEALEESIISDYSESEIHNAYNMFFYNYDHNIERYYSDKNISVTIEDKVENRSNVILFSNDNHKDAISSVSEEITYTVFYDTAGISHYSRDMSTIDYENGTFILNNYDKVDCIENRTCQVTVRIPKNMEFTDRFYLLDRAIHIGYSLRKILSPLSVFSLITSIFLIVYIFSAAGHRDGGDTITENYVDKIPFDIHTLFIAILYIIASYIISEILDYSSDWPFVIPIVSGMYTVGYFFTVGYLLSVATRIKSKRLFKNCILYYVFKFIRRILITAGKFIKNIISALPTVWKTVVFLGVLIFTESVLFAFNAFETDNLTVLFIVSKLFWSAFIIISSVGFAKIKSGGEKIVNGDLDTKIDTKYIYGDLKSFGESLNNINDGLQVAIEDKIKSERMKTELITNVSHDIKTPLTSIINYVDIIKKEEIENPKIAEYIGVLDRQSIRLKKLIEDLVEASKASTGNLSVDLAPCNVGVLLNQAVGEYDERLKTKNLDIILQIPDETVTVLADGRRLWRVFDNLLNNIIKYAQSGTRVYIEVKIEGAKAVTVFKNISQYALNITGEELTERFVRGDRSRNTEGSGLGLSIAKSLVELQGGEMNIVIDGDLFKAVITFDTVG